MRQKNIFVACILAVFMLAQPVWQIAGVSAKTWLVWLAAAAGGILLLYGKRGIAVKRTALTNLLAIALLGNILQILLGAVTMSGCEESSLLAVALLMLFYLIYTQVEYKRAYVWPVLVCAAILYSGLLWNFLADPSYTFGLRPFLENRDVLVSLLLLVSVAAAETYCREEEQTKRIFCLILAVLGYFLLFAVRDVIGMALLGVTFPASVLVYRPEKNYIQRNMRLTFLYFFMLSNMSLLTNYTSLLKTEVSYSLEDSIYLDLAIAAAGSVFFAWQDKLPAAGGEAYENFRRAMGWILAGCGIAFALLLLPGSEAWGEELSGSATLISRISEELRRAAGRHGGFFYEAAYRYGTAGAVWLICAAMTAGNRIRQLRLQGNIEPEAAVFFLVFLLQSVFYSPQPVTTPIYLLFAAMALHGGTGKAETTAFGRVRKTVAAASHSRAQREQKQRMPRFASHPYVKKKRVGTDGKERKRRERDSGVRKERDMEIWSAEKLFSKNLLPDSRDRDLLHISHKDTGCADSVRAGTVRAGIGEYYQHDSDVRRDPGKRAERTVRVH